MWQVLWIVGFAVGLAWLQVASGRTAGLAAADAALPPVDAALWAELDALAGGAPTLRRRRRRLGLVLGLTAALATVVVAVSDFFGPAPYARGTDANTLSK